MGFRRGHFFSALAGVIVGVMLVAVLPAGADNGDPIYLGQANTAKSTTRISVNYGMVIRSFRADVPAATFKVSSGAPIAVNSTGLVTDLNADLLDGMEAAAFAVTGHDHDTDYLAVDGTAVDSYLLDGMDSGAFSASGHDHDAAYAALGHGHALGDLGDTTITDTTTGEILRWSGSAWVNATLAEAGIASAVHEHGWSDLTSGVPAGLDDGDDDTLDGLSCPTDQIAKMTGSGWACADDDSATDADTLDGFDSTDFLGASAQVADSAGLGGAAPGLFVGGLVAGGDGLPILGIGCLYRGGSLMALARDGSPYCSAPTGDGTFTDSGQSLDTSQGEGGALGDLDGDGDLDAFVVNWDAGNTVWFNDGTGIFSDSGQSLGSASSGGVALGDLDGDGDLDAYVANGGNDKIWVNDGSGVFSAGQSISFNYSKEVALGDLDGDGDLDAFVIRSYSEGSSNSSSGVWFNDGSGTFSKPGPGLGTNMSMSVALGDIDGDGHLDAYVGNVAKNRLWMNDGSGGFTDYGVAFGASIQTRGVAIGDLDDDGDLDVFDANGGSNVVWFNDGDGNLSDSGVTYSSSNTNSLAVALGDLDGDGYLDAYIADYGTDDVWLNDGDGTFTNTGQSLDTGIGYGLALGDLDGDGDLDAFVVNEASADRVWLD